MRKKNVKRPVRGHYRTINGSRVWVERHTTTKQMGRTQRNSFSSYPTTKNHYSSLDYKRDLKYNMNRNDSFSKKVIKSIRNNSSVISEQITNAIEYGYTFSSGDIFTFIKNKGVEKGINLATNKICEDIDQSGVYETLKEEYNLSDTEIITIKRILKKVIQKVIEYVADKIINYLDSKEMVTWAEKTVKDEIQQQVKKYFYNTSEIFETRNIKAYYNPQVFIHIPYEITTIAKKEIQNKKLRNKFNLYELNPFIYYISNIYDFKTIIENGIDTKIIGKNKIEGILIYAIDNKIMNRKDLILKSINIKDKIIIIVKPELEFKYYNKEEFKAYTQTKINLEYIKAVIINNSLKDLYKFEIKEFKTKLKHENIPLYTIG